jgi:hypothetical protein
MDGMNLPTRTRLQALVDPRRTFSVSSPLAPAEAVRRLSDVLRERHTRFRGHASPVFLVYRPAAYMTPIRPVVEGEIGPAGNGSVIEGSVRLSWGVRVGAAVLLVYLVLYGVVGVAYALATAQGVAALSVLALPAAYGVVRLLRYLFAREARAAVE